MSQGLPVQLFPWGYYHALVPSKGKQRDALKEDPPDGGSAKSPSSPVSITPSDSLQLVSPEILRSLKFCFIN